MSGVAIDSCFVKTSLLGFSGAVVNNWNGCFLLRVCIDRSLDIILSWNLRGLGFKKSKLRTKKKFSSNVDE